MNWSDDRVETLKKLWADGESASKIAMKIGGVTRNAVIGKASRLGLPTRLGLSRRMHSPRPRSDLVRSPGRHMGVAVSHLERMVLGKTVKAGIPGGESNARPLPDASEELVIPPAERKSLEDLEPRHCRWPIGDPRAPDFHFCGKGKVEGKPYCEFHVRRAYVTTRVADPESNDGWRRKPQRIMANVQQVNFAKEPA
jgi:GcrA cell cycle regulator